MVVIQYIPRNMHTVFALLCFVVVIHWRIFPYPSGLLHWHCGNLTIVPVPAKQPWWIWINTSCEFIMNDCITTTKQSTTKPCAYFFGYTVGCPAKIHRGWNLAKSGFPIDSCSVTEYWKTQNAVVWLLFTKFHKDLKKKLLLGQKRLQTGFGRTACVVKGHWYVTSTLQRPCY